MPSDSDMVHTGASSLSMPKPDLTEKVVYNPGQWSRVENELQTSKSISSINNQVDLLKLRVNFLEDAIMGLMEQKNFTDTDLLEWFQTNREKLARLTKQQQ